MAISASLISSGSLDGSIAHPTTTLVRGNRHDGQLVHAVHASSSHGSAMTHFVDEYIEPMKNKKTTAKYSDLDFIIVARFDLPHDINH